MGAEDQRLSNASEPGEERTGRDDEHDARHGDGADEGEAPPARDAQPDLADDPGEGIRRTRHQTCGHRVGRADNEVGLGAECRCGEGCDEVARSTSHKGACDQTRCEFDEVPAGKRHGRLREPGGVGRGDGPGCTPGGAN